MHTASATREEQPRRSRPSRLTVFTTAFVAGAAVAFGVNRMLDVHLAQTRPQVECEPIFVALHSLPQGSPVTVWDVALKDWPRAMLPASALRARDTFEGMVLRHPLREGQPLLSVQLVPSSTATTPAAGTPEPSFTPPLPATPASQAAAAPEADLWAPAEPAIPKVAAVPRPQTSRTDVEFVAPEPQAVSSVPVTASPEVGTSDRDMPATAPAADVDVAGRREQEGQAPSEPTLADTPDAAAPSETASVEPQPQAAPGPGLLPQSEPLYAPVPASPPADLEGALSGIGSLSATNDTPRGEQDTSVLKNTPATAAAEPAQHSPSAGRYLVVPERIALQADSSFAPPQAAQSAAPSPAESPAQRPRSRNASSPGKSPAKAPQRSATSAAPAKRTQPNANAAGRQSAAATSRPLGGMFPNLSAGIEAWTNAGKPVAAQPSASPR